MDRRLSAEALASRAKLTILLEFVVFNLQLACPRAEVLQNWPHHAGLNEPKLPARVSFLILRKRTNILIPWCNCKTASIRGRNRLLVYTSKNHACGSAKLADIAGSLGYCTHFRNQNLKYLYVKLFFKNGEIHENTMSKQWARWQNVARNTSMNSKCTTNSSSKRLTFKRTEATAQRKRGPPRWVLKIPIASSEVATSPGVLLS